MINSWSLLFDELNMEEQQTPNEINLNLESLSNKCDSGSMKRISL